MFVSEEVSFYFHFLSPENVSRSNRTKLLAAIIVLSNPVFQNLYKYLIYAFQGTG